MSRVTFFSEDMLEALYDSPLRPSVLFDFRPHWRWDEAVRVARKSRLPIAMKRKDPYLAELVRYHRAFQNLKRKPQQQIEYLKREFPHIYEAERIYSERRFNRWYLEAVLCANLPLDRVCDVFPVSLATLASFEFAFFDVRPVLKYPAFFYGNLLEPVVDGKAVGMSELLLKLFAYVGGEKGISLYLDAGSDFGSEQLDILKRILRGRAVKNAISAAMTVSPNQYNSIDLQRLHLDFEESVRVGQESGQTTSEQIVVGLLSSTRSIMGDQMIMDQPEVQGRAALPDPRQVAALSVRDFILKGGSDD